MQPLTTAEIEKLNELIDGIQIAMMTTRHGDDLRSRPMMAQACEADGTLWFMTSRESEKAYEVENDDAVNVAFSHPGKERYVSVAGRAELVDDIAKKEQLWSPFAKIWFEGPTDPKLVLLKISITGVEYWDTPGGKMVSLYGLIKSLITGKEDMKSENKSFGVA